MKKQKKLKSLRLRIRERLGKIVDCFEARVAKWLPGLKTKLVSLIGIIASVAAVVQEYISGLPLSDLIKPEHMVWITIGLFTLTYWTRRLASKYE